MTIPTGTGGSWFDLQYLDIIDAGSAAQSMREAGQSPHEFEGIANSFIYRPRGPQSSEGWFLCTRHDLDKGFPQILGEGLLTSSEETTNKDLGWESQAITLTIKNDPTSFGTVAAAAQTDIKISNLYIESAYCVTGVPAPAGYVRPNWTADRSKFSDQENSASNAWDMQLCVVHVVDIRWYLQHSDKVSQVEHYLPRPFLLKDESFGAADTINYGTNVTGSSYGYQDLLHTLSAHWSNITMDSTGADYPTLCRNYGLVGLDEYRCMWEILDEISHTIVFDFIKETASYDGFPNSVKILPKGSDNSTTATERTTFKNLHLLSEISNDVRPKKGVPVYSVYFPLEGGNTNWKRSSFDWDHAGGGTPTNRRNIQGYRPAYLCVNVRLSGSSSTSTVVGYHVAHASAMTSLYGSNGVPLDGQFKTRNIKGHLLVRQNDGTTTAEMAYTPGSVGSGAFDNASGPVSNHQEIIDHAKELAVLRGKQDHYESRGKVILDETYIGLLKFTPTKDLSAIIWKNTGGGATTRIINQAFAEDRDGRSSTVANYPSPVRVEHVEFNEFPPDNFHDEFRHLAMPSKALSAGSVDFWDEDEVYVVDLGHLSSTGTNGDAVSISVKNKSKLPVINADTSKMAGAVEVFWNRYDEEWQSHHYPSTVLVQGGNIQYVNSSNALASTGIPMPSALIAGTTNLDITTVISGGSSAGTYTATAKASSTDYLIYFKISGGSYTSLG